MTALALDGPTARRLAARIAPIVIIFLAGLAVRTPLAAGYPFVSLLLFLWIVLDTLMLSLIARAPGRPVWPAVAGVAAGASVIVALGVPPAIRAVLLETPAIMAIMAVAVVAHVAWALARARRTLAVPDGTARDRWIAAASELLPPSLVRIAAAELMLLHMALFRWGGPPDMPANSRAFAYHRHLAPICATMLVLCAIEVGVLHLLLAHWNASIALILFVISDLGFLYMVGLIKSFRFRPVLVTPDGVRIRAGYAFDQLVPWDAIAGIETHVDGETMRDSATLNAALMAWPNLVLRLGRPIERRSLLKGMRAYTVVAFRLDDPEPFVRLARWRLGQAGGL